MAEKNNNGSEKIKTFVYIIIGSITIISFIYTAFANISKAKDDININIKKICNNKTLLNKHNDRLTKLETSISNIDLKMGFVKEKVYEQKTNTDKILDMVQKLYAENRSN